jgi:precorrin-8X/cobalt-precorrin-8 methylmutase
VLVDSEMVSQGVIRPRLPRENMVICTVSGAQAGSMAEKKGIARSVAAVELWRPFLQHAIVSIGNAPAALFHLLDIIAAGAPKPALILGFPVGFVGAAESKKALAESGLPHIALMGRRGGSAMAAAAVNALALEREA